MSSTVIYHGSKKMVHRIYHNHEIVYEHKPIVFQLQEDGKLIILGAYSIIERPEGIYLDCEPNLPEDPETSWIYPVQEGNVLTIEQVYSAVQNGNVLEVE